MAKLARANTHHQAEASRGWSQSSSSDAGSNSQDADVGWDMEAVDAAVESVPSQGDLTE